MAIDEPAAQSDDVYERISFLNPATGEVLPGVMGWREGIENRVVFQVWGGPSFAATGPDVNTARRQAREGIEKLGFQPLVDEEAPSDAPLPTPRIEPVLWWLTIAIVLALLIPVLAGAEIPQPGQTVAFPNAAYDWRYDGPDFDPRSASEQSAVRQRALTGQMALVPRITILDRQHGKPVARYELANAAFCDYEDDNCELDGIFPIILSSDPAQPVLVVISHVGAHGQKLSVFQPLKNAHQPVFEAVADYALAIQLLPDGISVELAQAGKQGTGRRETRTWQAGAMAVPCPVPVNVTLPVPPRLTQAAEVLASDLKRITRERDLAAFMALLTDEVLVSFGGNGGRDELIEYWALHTDAGRARFWAELDRVLAYGGWHAQADPQSVTWPWFFSAWPPSDDAYDIFFADTDTLVRAGPHAHSPVLTRLPFAPLRVAAPDGEPQVVDWLTTGWLPVAVPGHCLGYVPLAQVRPLLGTRMIARRINGAWKIEAFVAGD